MNKIHAFLFALLLWVKPGFAQTELISNNGFDNSVPPWHLETNAANICSGSNAPTGQNFGCLNPNRFLIGEGDIWQEVNFPTCVQTATISFYLSMIRLESSDPVDKLEVRVQDLNNANNIVVVDYYYNYLTGFTNFTKITLEVHPQDIKQISVMSRPALVFAGDNVSGETAWAFDDVHFIVTRGAPQVDFFVTDSVIYPGWSVDFFNFTTGAPTGWLWKFYNGSSGAGYQTSTDYDPIEITYNKSGTFNVTLTATNALGTTTKTKQNYITVKSAVGIETNPDAPTFSLRTYPNPVTEFLYIQLGYELVNTDAVLSVRNQLGEELLYTDIVKGTRELKYDVSGFASGLYIISITSEDIMMSHKIVKN